MKWKKIVSIKLLVNCRFHCYFSLSHFEIKPYTIRCGRFISALVLSLFDKPKMLNKTRSCSKVTMGDMSQQSSVDQYVMCVCVAASTFMIRPEIEIFKSIQYATAANQYQAHFMNILRCNRWAHGTWNNVEFSRLSLLLLLIFGSENRINCG